MGAFDVLTPEERVAYEHISDIRKEVMGPEYVEPDQPGAFRSALQTIAHARTEGAVPLPGVEPFRKIAVGDLTPEQLELLKKKTPLERLRFLQTRPETLAEIMSMPSDKFNQIMMTSERQFGMPPPPQPLVKVSEGVDVIRPSAIPGEAPEVVYQNFPDPEKGWVTLYSKANEDEWFTMPKSAEKAINELTKGKDAPYYVGPAPTRATTKTITGLPPAMKTVLAKQINDRVDALGRVISIRKLVNEFGNMTDEFMTIKGQSKAWLYKQMFRMGMFEGEDYVSEAEFVADFGEFKRRIKKHMNKTLNELSGAAVSDQELQRLRQEIFDLEKQSPPDFRRRVVEIERELKLITARKIYFLKNGYLANPADTIKLADTEAMIREKQMEAVSRHLSMGASDDEAYDRAADDVRQMFGIALEDL